MHTVKAWSAIVPSAIQLLAVAPAVSSINVMIVLLLNCVRRLERMTAIPNHALISTS